MKRSIVALISVALVAVVTFLLIDFSSNDGEIDVMEQKREKHRKFLAESPFNKTKNLTKTERKNLGLPPNAYNERLWELTMNPDLGYPTPFLVGPIDVNLLRGKASPGSTTSPWVERGPLNVGGRTRVVFFDPNDVGANNGDGVDYNRVFAGAVGGGLWVNDDITDSNNPWTQVPGIASGLSISSYAIDPNDSNTIYLGTGEQYTDGAAIGNGLYRSKDGGASWEEVIIPPSGNGTFNTNTSILSAGVYFINDIAIRDVDGNSELYVGITSAIYSSPNFSITSPNSFLGVQNAGLYRSTDNGSTWSRIEDDDFRINIGGFDTFINPNDFEIAPNNQLYMGSIGATGVNQGGGLVFTSSDGIEWTQVAFIPFGDRVEIASSRQNPEKFYVLTQTSSTDGPGVDLRMTTDNFNTLNILSEPDDADNGIPSDDFTRGQAFYDLVVEVNPVNDEMVYLGGINLHRSVNNGQNWTQLSKWSNNPNMNNFDIPLVHADIHAVTFKPQDPDKALIGSDGGVSYANSFNRAPTSSSAIQNRTLGYNVTQFYYGDIAQRDFDNGGEFLAGSQDNGTQVFNNSNTSQLSSTTDISGGDGSYTAIDDESGYAILGYTSRNHYYVQFPLPSVNNILFNLIPADRAYEISDESDGDFINVAELDSRFDILFANSRTAIGGNSITACELGSNSAECVEITAGAIAQGRPTAMSASPFATESPTLFVGSQDSRVFKITNANSAARRSVTNLSSPDFLGSVSDIEFGDSELEIYVTFHNYGVNNVWFTNDGGLTWAQKDGNLPDIPVKAILRNPLLPNEVIIGTQQGIFSTTDFDSASPTWTPSINGMTNVPVYDLDLRTADNTVLATTHGRGLFTGKFTADTASITAPVDENQLKVFPTQATSEIFISTKLNYNNADVTIFNLNGQQVYQQKKSLSSSRQRIDVSGLSTGLYLLKVRGNGINQTVKFVKEL